VHTESVRWMPTIDENFSLRLDGLSLVFLMQVLVIGAGVLAYSTRYLHHEDTAFYFYICGFAASMAVVVTTDNSGVCYLAWALTTLCSYFCIASWGEKGRQASSRTLLVPVLGGLFLLGAPVIMALNGGTMSISEVLASRMCAECRALLATVGFLIV